MTRGGVAHSFDGEHPPTDRCTYPKISWVYGTGVPRGKSREVTAIVTLGPARIPVLAKSLRDICVSGARIFEEVVCDEPEVVAILESFHVFSYLQFHYIIFSAKFAREFFFNFSLLGFEFRPEKKILVLRHRPVGGLRVSTEGPNYGLQMGPILGPRDGPPMGLLDGPPYGGCNIFVTAPCYGPLV